MGQKEKPDERATPHDSVLTPHAWFFWLVSAVALTILARNPLYSGLMLLLATILYSRVRPRGTPLPLNWVRLGGVMILLSTLFFTLSLHSGNTILVHLPNQWPLIGGIWTGEAAALGANNGLLLLTLLALFAVFNRAVAPSELLSLTPRALHQLGLVALIALTYVPETLAQGRRIREAQAIRGREPQGWRDWRPLLLPLLITGLERALEVAEAMVARGYGATAAKPHSAGRQMGMLIGLAAAFLGWLLYLAHNRWGWLLLASGVATLLVLVWQAGRDVQVTRYQAIVWHPLNTITILAVILPWLSFFWISPASLPYTPFPQLALPPFQPVWGLSLLLFLTPILRE